MVRVFENGEFAFDVGCFADVDAVFNWIYRQVGILKTHHPDEPLRKIRWRYVKNVGFLENPVADVKVELGQFGFEVFVLRPPQYTNVVEELVESRALPEWAEGKLRDAGL